MSKPRFRKPVRFNLSQALRSRLVRRQMIVGQRRYHVGVEAEFWKRLKLIAEERGLDILHLIAEIDLDRGETKLSQAVREFVRQHYERPAALPLDRSPSQPEAEIPKVA